MRFFFIDAENTESKTDENEEEKAAIKIQASYRGYKTRASLKSDSVSQLTEGKSAENGENTKEEDEQNE